MKTFLYTGFLLALFSCEKLIIPPSMENTPENTFETLWKSLDEGYSFFEYKGIQWDSIYTVYRSKISNNMTERALFDTCSKMLLTLRDAHVNLRAGFATSYYDYYSMAPSNFNSGLLERTYWKGFEKTGPLVHTILGGDVGYIYYASFATPFTDEELDVVVNRFNSIPNIKGVVIDVRNNGGGNPINGYKLLSRIIDIPTVLYFTKYKDGPGHNEFTSWREAILDPNKEGEPDFKGKIVVLTNRRCYSACNFFAAATKAIPEITLMGDTTGGGGGQPVGYELPNTWSVNFSGSQTILNTGEQIEGGVVPDQLVYMLPTDETNGIDTIIETALQEIR